MRNLFYILEDELPMDDASRMQRATELGFTIKAFHGTDSKFNEFDLEKGRSRQTTGFAPHFASKKAEANGYSKMAKSMGKDVNVMHVLLRIKNPWNNNYDFPISKKTYVDVVGNEPESAHDLFGGRVIHDLKRVLSTKHGAGNHHPCWVEIYRKLISLGYDAMVDDKTPGDHTSGYYGKYIVLDPKNIRSIHAAFDPAHSNSRNLMS